MFYNIKLNELTILFCFLLKKPNGSNNKKYTKRIQKVTCEATTEVMCLNYTLINIDKMWITVLVFRNRRFLNISSENGEITIIKVFPVIILQKYDFLNTR